MKFSHKFLNTYCFILCIKKKKSKICENWVVDMVADPLNHSEVHPSTIAAHFVSLYYDLKILTIFLLTSTTFNILHSASLHTVSKAVLKSMKFKLLGTLCFLAFSAIYLTIKIAFTAPLPGRKPYWMSLENVCISSRTHEPQP